MADMKKAINEAFDEAITEVGCDHDWGNNDYFNIGYNNGLEVGRRIALAVLKKQPEIVRCKDCRDYLTIYCTCDGCCISDDWYCADGERR